MMLESVGGNIQIAAQRALNLRSGDLVSINVIKHLEGNKWAVGIQGRVFPAFSKLELQPGAILRARVTAGGSRLILAIENEHGDPSLAALARQGLSGGKADALMAAALLRSGLSVAAELVEKMRAVITRSGLQKERAARGLAVLAEKGIDISSHASDKLLEVFSFGERGGEDHRKYKKRELPKDKGAAKAIRSILAEPAGKADSLAVFNHLKGKNQSWIVVPFLYGEGADEYPGTIKLLYDPYMHRPSSMSVSVAPNGGPSMDFYLTLEGKKKLSVFCGDPDLRASMKGLYAEFAAEFHNIGFEVDDTIYGSESFDGFSPVWEGASVRGIDTVG
jgi:hypothetical protein